jgi:hypothetical protein
MSMPDIMIGRARGLTRDTPTSAHHVIIARALFDTGGNHVTVVTPGAHTWRYAQAGPVDIVRIVPVAHAVTVGA